MSQGPLFKETVYGEVTLVKGMSYNTKFGRFLSRNKTPQKIHNLEELAIYAIDSSFKVLQFDKDGKRLKRAGDDRVQGKKEPKSFTSLAVEPIAETAPEDSGEELEDVSWEDDQLEAETEAESRPEVLSWKPSDNKAELAAAIESRTGEKVNVDDSSKNEMISLLEELDASKE